MCEQIAQGWYLVMDRARVKPATSVRHATVKQLSNTHDVKQHHVRNVRRLQR